MVKCITSDFIQFSCAPLLPLSSQRQRLIRESGVGGSSVKTFGSGGIENGGSVERPLQDGEIIVPDGGGKVGDNSRDPEDDDEGDETFRPFQVPGYFISVLVLILLQVTGVNYSSLQFSSLVGKSKKVILQLCHICAN